MINKNIIVTSENEAIYVGELRNKPGKIKDHPSLIYAADLKEICKPLEQLGINYFSHVYVDNNQNFSALGLEPEFVKLYFEKKYYNFDIHQMKTTQSEQHIIWDCVEISGETKELDDDYRAMGLGHTFTIIQTIHGNTQCFHFGAQLGNPQINQIYVNNIDFLKQFINYFFEKIQKNKELYSAYDIKFLIEQKKGSYLVSQEEILSIADSNKMYVTHNLSISRREWDCLYWLSQGKTLEEISIILLITLRTVKAHIGNLKDKLNCQNLFQLGAFYHQLQNTAWRAYEPHN